MRKIQIGAALIAVLAFSAFATASAFAATEFLISGESAKAGTLLLSEAVALLLEDVKGGPFGEAVHVTCSGFNLAVVVSATDIEILALWGLSGTEREEGAESKIKCEVNAGICGTAELTAIDLPWLAEPVLVGEASRGTLVKTTNGAPGYNVECSKIAEDKCTGEKGTVKLENGTKGEVNSVFESIFNENGKRGTCTRGGAEAAHVEGTIKFTEPAGLELQVS